MTMEPQIHPTAIVHPDATLGAGVKVWHWTHVREFATLCRGVSVGQGCYIDHHVMIGAETRIQNHVSVYYGVTIARNVFVGPGVRFTNDKRPRVHSDWDQVTTLVDEGVSLGAGAVILPVHIEAYAMIAAGAVVTTHVHRHAVMRGNPARCVGFVCHCGATIETEEANVPCPTCHFSFADQRLPWARIAPASEPWRP